MVIQPTTTRKNFPTWVSHDLQIMLLILLPIKGELVLFSVEERCISFSEIVVAERNLVFMGKSAAAV